MENKLEKLIKKIDDKISKKGYLEIGYVNELRRLVKTITKDEEEADKLVYEAEDYLSKNYECIDDDLSSYTYSKELHFENVDDFYKYFKISEKSLMKRYKF